MNIKTVLFHLLDLSDSLNEIFKRMSKYETPKYMMGKFDQACKRICSGIYMQHRQCEISAGIASNLINFKSGTSLDLIEEISGKNNVMEFLNTIVGSSLENAHTILKSLTSFSDDFNWDDKKDFEDIKRSIIDNLRTLKAINDNMNSVTPVFDESIDSLKDN